MAEPIQSSRFHFTGKAFLIGIPAWGLVCILWDLLNRAMMGMTGAGGEFGNIPTTLLTPTSYLVFTYFVLSFVLANVAKTRKWRLWSACLAHTVLAASIAAAVLPNYIEEHDSDKLVKLLVILSVIYGLLFLPWMIAWVRLVMRSR